MRLKITAAAVRLKIPAAAVRVKDDSGCPTIVISSSKKKSFWFQNKPLLPKIWYGTEAMQRNNDAPAATARTVLPTPVDPHLIALHGW